MNDALCVQVVCSFVILLLELFIALIPGKKMLHALGVYLNCIYITINHTFTPVLTFRTGYWVYMYPLVGERLDQCSINRRCPGTIVFGH